jgi:hypothetical protein
MCLVWSERHRGATASEHWCCTPWRSSMRLAIDHQRNIDDGIVLL